MTDHGGVTLRKSGTTGGTRGRDTEEGHPGHRGRPGKKLAGDLKKRYAAGESIRALAASTGRSYGFIHRILSESGVTLRGRGGATRGKSKR
ncbi:hypothetical protein GCM10020001_007930 [Nonomuraea salmonea]